MTFTHFRKVTQKYLIVYLSWIKNIDSFPFVSLVIAFYAERAIILGLIDLCYVYSLYHCTNWFEIITINVYTEQKIKETNDKDSHTYAASVQNAYKTLFVLYYKNVHN